MRFTNALTFRHSRLRCSLLIAVLQFPGTTTATPILALPINSQVPPIARVGEPYSFVFAASTFSGNSSALQYATNHTPTWLQLDGPNRAFSGTPPAGSLGPLNFSLVASDSSGSATDSVVFIVLEDAGPSLGKSIAQQLPEFGNTSGPDTLVLYPASALSLRFDPDTFTNTDSSTDYSALCANNTPLPSWISFEPANLSFSGTSPHFDSPDELPQDFDIHLTASDIAGFSAAVATFHITIGLHELTFSSQQFIINATSTQPIAYEGLQDALTLDGSIIKPSDLKNISTDAPEWLSIDVASLQISGIAPNNLMPQAFTVTAEDVYGDFAETTIYLSTGSPASLIVGEIPTLYAQIGQKFSHTFSRTHFPMPNVSIALDMGNASSWLQFDSNSLTVFGVAPTDLSPQADTLNLTAAEETNTASVIVCLDVVSANQGPLPSPSSTVQSSPSSTSNGEGSASATAVSDTSSNMNSENQKVAAAAILPIIGVLALLFCIWLVRKRRKTLGDGGEQKSLMRRFRPPEMIIGEPEDFERRSRRSRPTSRRWSLPRVELSVPVFTIPLDRNRHSQLGSSERGAKDCNQNFWDPTIKDSEHEGALSRKKSLSPRKLASRKFKAHPDMPSKSLIVGSKKPARSRPAITQTRRVIAGMTGRVSARPSLHGLGHGRGTPIPCVLQELAENQRTSNLDSHDSGIGKEDIDRNGHFALKIPSAAGLRPARHVHSPSDEYYTTDSNATSCPGSTSAHSEDLDPRRPNLSKSKARNGIDDGTVRLVNTSPDHAVVTQLQSDTTSSATKRDTTSLMRKRDSCFHNRRGVSNDSTNLASRSLQRLSSWTYDLNTEDYRSGLGFSTIPRGSLSAQRKGQMMQMGIGSLASHTYRIANRFQSVNSLATDPRFEDPDETENSSTNNTDSIWEDDEPDEYGNKIWRKAEEGSTTSYGGRGSRLSMQRLSYLMRQHRERSQDGELTLGNTGKKPVSVQNDMDVARGMLGSKSLKGTLAFP